MARYNPYGSRIAQPEMIDTGDVPYISYQSENFLPTVSQGMGEMQKRYDIAQSAMAKYIEENAALKARGADYQNVMNRLDEELANIKSTVKDTYGGDYGAAVNEVIKKLGKARGIYHQAQQEYERALPYEQEMAKLQSQGKLLFTPDAQGNIVDPRTQAAFDERGNYTPVDYNRFREQSDYVKEAQPLVEKVNKLIKEDPTWRSKYGYLGAVTLQGLNALDEKDLDKLIESYAPIFEKDTTYGIDPKYKDLSSKDFLKNTVKSLASSGEKADWMKDWISERRLEEIKKRKDIYGAGVLSRISKNDLLEGRNSFEDMLKVPTTDILNGTLPSPSTPGGMLLTGKAKSHYDNIDDAIKATEIRIKDYTKNNLPLKAGAVALSNPLTNPLGEALTKSYKDNIVEAQQQLSTLKRYKEEKLPILKDALKKQGFKNIDNMSTREIFKLADQQEGLLTDVVSELFPITNKDVYESISNQLSNRLETVNFYDDSGKTSSTALGDVLGKDETTKENVRKYLQTGKVIPMYDSRTGKFMVEVSKKFDDKGNPEGNETRKLYFSPDTEHIKLANALEEMEKSITNSSGDFNYTILPGQRDVFVYVPELNGPKEQLTDKLNTGMIAVIPIEMLSSIPAKDHEKFIKENYSRYPIINLLQYRGKAKESSNKILTEGY